MNDISKKLNDLIDSYKSIILSTYIDGYPYTSYAPVVRDGNKFYILISKTAPHFKGVSNGKVAGLFISDESNTENIFFRNRVHYVFDAKLSIEDSIKEKFINIHGKTAEMVLKMDFEIFELTIKKGKLVLGPGQAYLIDSNNNVLKRDNDGNSHGMK